jgi:hypothetical protein
MSAHEPSYGTEGRRMVGAQRDSAIERLQELEVRNTLLTAERDTLAQLLRERQHELNEAREALARVALSIVPAGRA